jgi:hypothetical protein
LAVATKNSSGTLVDTDFQEAITHVIREHFKASVRQCAGGANLGGQSRWGGPTPMSIRAAHVCGHWRRSIPTSC